VTPATPVPVAVTARRLFDYRHAFALDADELTVGPILDCPAGAFPFAAQVRARGGAVTSVDPIYDQPAGAIVGRVAANLAQAHGWVAVVAAEWPHQQYGREVGDGTGVRFEMFIYVDDVDATVAAMGQQDVWKSCARPRTCPGANAWPTSAIQTATRSGWRCPPP